MAKVWRCQGGNRKYKWQLNNKQLVLTILKLKLTVNAKYVTA